jgi:hypothetical protein
MRALATQAGLHYISIMSNITPQKPPAPPVATDAAPVPAAPPEPLEAALAKPERLDPTRYGDWELNGKCVDF